MRGGHHAWVVREGRERGGVGGRWSEEVGHVGMGADWGVVGRARVGLLEPWRGGPRLRRWGWVGRGGRHVVLCVGRAGGVRRWVRRAVRGGGDGGLVVLLVGRVVGVLLLLVVLQLGRLGRLVRVLPLLLLVLRLRQVLLRWLWRLLGRRRLLVVGVRVRAGGARLGLGGGGEGSPEVADEGTEAGLAGLIWRCRVGRVGRGGDAGLLGRRLVFGRGGGALGPARAEPEGGSRVIMEVAVQAASGGVCGRGWGWG